MLISIQQKLHKISCYSLCILRILKADEKQGEYDDDEKMQLRVDGWFYVFRGLSLIYFTERNCIKYKYKNKCQEFVKCY